MITEHSKKAIHYLRKTIYALNTIKRNLTLEQIRKGTNKGIEIEIRNLKKAIQVISNPKDDLGDFFNEEELELKTKQERHWKINM